MTEPTPETPPTPAEPQGQPSTDPAPAGQPETGGQPQEKDWKAEAEKWKNLSRKNEAQAKENADAAKRLAEIEDANKTEAEKLAERAKAAEDRAEAATRLAVASKVEALASGRFQDPQDAVDALKDGAFVGEDGTVQADAIQAALDGLLERKPHWARTEPGPRLPQPDPSQGARPGATPTLQQQIAEAEQSGDTKRALALKTRQLREMTTTKK